MKISWGKGIVLAFTLFISFILYFVIKVQTNPKYDNDLVVDEYYKKDTKFGEEMAQLKNAAVLKEQVAVVASDNGIAVTFPSEFSPDKINGTISLYRPSDKKLDFEQKISLTGATQLIPRASLAGGRWDITITWEYEGSLYIKKQIAYLN